MAIVPLVKVTFYGAATQQPAVIERLQELGCLHLIDMGRSAGAGDRGDVSHSAREALRFLRSCPQQLRQIRRLHDFDRERVVDESLAIARRQQELRDERDELQQAIENVQPWGDFLLPEEGCIGDVRFWFYVVPLREASQLAGLPYVIREISRDPFSAYVVVVHTDEPDGMPGQRRDLDPRSLSALRDRLEQVDEELEELEHERMGLTRWCDLLAGDLDAADDQIAQQRAAELALGGRNVFALRGWAPRSAQQRIREFAGSQGLAVSVEPPGEADRPPTLLDNPDELSGSEALVTFYKTPVYGAWDPSLIAFGSFALFFAMIVADAGYGIVLAVLTAYLWKRLGHTSAGRRTRNVLAVIVGCTLVYGLFCGSYFGISPAANSVLGRLQFLDAESQAVMMPLTIVIGVIHLSLANLVVAWTQRGKLTALASLGWVAFMIGAALAGIGALADVSEQASESLGQIGAVLLGGGLLAVFLFSSSRPLFSLSVRNHVLRFFDGLVGLTGVSGLFGDVLSYLRLFALGLSSAKLSQTFNNLGASAWDAAGFGVIAAIGIVLLGHTLNLMLSIMGGVVHGLRLNCIEFFKWSLPDEGYLFQPFAKKARQP